ncbi:MAG: hypothetical protein ACI4TJ_07305 [Candidatus Cryptobacteroides sp.]
MSDKALPDVYDRIAAAEGNSGIYVTKNHVKQLVSYDGTVLEPFVIDGVYSLEYEVSGDKRTTVMVDDIMVYCVDRWEGLMDAVTGRIITPACYWNFEMASKDLCRAELGFDGESVIIDKTGRVIGNR